MDVILGALYAGLITGGIAIVCGAIKGKLGLGMGGFFCCLVSGLLLGFLLALPICAIFLWQIFKKDPKIDYEDGTPPPAQPSSSRFCCNCGNPVSPSDRFCNSCGNALNHPPMN